MIRLRRAPSVLVLLSLIVGVLLIASSAVRNFPVVDELGHLAAGAGHWRFETFDLYRVNPPLPRLVATLPTALSKEAFDWDRLSEHRSVRGEFIIAASKLRKCRLGIQSIFIGPRLVSLSFFILAVYFFFSLLRDAIPGEAAKSYAIVLFCFCPNLISAFSTIVPDAAAVAAGIVATYFFWRYANKPSSKGALLCGVSLGFCLATKMTWVLLLGCFPFLMAACHFFLFLRNGGRQAFGLLRDVFVALVISIGFLNVVYLFEGTGKPLGSILFCSETLGGTGATTEKLGNRFHGTLVGEIPVLVPENYLLGIDYLKMEVEQRKWSFLDGEWRHGSWPNYYVMTTLYKTPEPTLIAAGLGTFVFIIGWWRGLAKPELVSMVLLLTIPAVMCFLSVSWQGGFNHHHRYVLMIYPPMFMFASLIASPLARQVFSWRKAEDPPDGVRRDANVTAEETHGPWWAVWQRCHWTQILAFALVCLSVTSSLRVHPHYTSYFNTLSGGPGNGWHRLGYSNIDWGQDILEVDKWLKKHPDRRPLRISLGYFGSNGELFDLPIARPIELPLDTSVDEVRRSVTETQWWIINVKELYNRPGYPGLQYLQQIQPVDRIAYAYHVYRIDPLATDSSHAITDSSP